LALVFDNSGENFSMPSVVIIHAGEDTLPARALAEKLRAANLTPILEQSNSDALRSAIKTAPVTIALWSPRSVEQPSLADEVSFARGKSKVLHATMQNAAIPEAFRGDKTVNLTGWRGEDEFPAWRELAKLVTEKAGVKPLPPPAPRPASGFFQPGVVRETAGATAAPARGRPAPQAAPQQARSAPRPAPAPQRTQAPPRPTPAPAESSGGGGRGMMIALITFAVVAVAGGSGYYFWNQSQSSATTTAWDGVAQNDADALRAFLAGDPGDYRDEAQAALAALEERSYESASDSDTIEAFEAFLNDFPESEHAIAARGRIAELQSMPADVPVEEVDPNALPPTEATPPDADLVPPDSTAATPDGGPAPITPPAPTPDPAAPTN
jgi:hypothetical protein